MSSIQLTLPEIERRRKISEAMRGENHPFYGKKHSEETRRKISEANRGEKNPMYGRKLSEEHKCKFSFLGEKHSEETRRKMSKIQKNLWQDPKKRQKRSESMRGENNPNYGKKNSEETRRKISEALLEKYRREKHPNYRRIEEKNPNYGRKRSEETRRKISEGNRGKTLSEKTRRKLSEAALGRKHSEETRHKMSEARRGENNWNWRGGISFDPYCPRFNYRRKEITRNKYARICVKCGKSALQNGQRLSVDHVDENKEQGCNGHKWQLVPLCKSCHSEFSNMQKHLMLSLLLLKNEKAELNMEVKTL